MNHCRDCNSDYSTPGTCNCFAVGGKRHAAPLTTPSVPYVQPYSPWAPPAYPNVIWGDATTGTIWYKAGPDGQVFDNVARSFTAGGNC